MRLRSMVKETPPRRGGELHRAAPYGTRPKRCLLPSHRRVNVQEIEVATIGGLEHALLIESAVATFEFGFQGPWQFREDCGEILVITLWTPGNSPSYVEQRQAHDLCNRLLPLLGAAG